MRTGTFSLCVPPVPLPPCPCSCLHPSFPSPRKVQRGGLLVQWPSQVQRATWHPRQDFGAVPSVGERDGGHFPQESQCGGYQSVRLLLLVGEGWAMGSERMKARGVEVRYLRSFAVYLSLLFRTFIYRPGHVQVVVIDKEPLFFSLRDGHYFPTLRVLHQCKLFFCDASFHLCVRVHVFCL